MIILRKKLFSVNKFNIPRDYTRDDKTFIQPVLNIIKAVEMWNLDDGEYVDHWIRQMAVDLVMFKLPKIHMSYQSALAAAIEEDDNRLSNAIGATECEYVREIYGRPIDFIDHVIYKLLSMTKRDDPDLPPKYFYARFGSKDPSSLNYTSRDYLIFLKYAALCISGQLDPFNVDRNYYNSIKEVYRLNVDYKVLKFKTIESLTDVIVKCIENFLGQGLPKKVKYYNFRV